jgi:hypothetical protein
MFGPGLAFALTAILTVCSLGAVVGFFVSTGRAVKKFDRLDPKAQDKLLLLEYYMAAVRNLSEDDLIRLSRLPDEAIRYFNAISDYDKRLGEIRKQIAGKAQREEGGPSGVLGQGGPRAVSDKIMKYR